MTRPILPVLVLLLSGCSLFGPRTPPTPVSPEQAACEAAANDDPEVKHLIIVGLGNPNFAHGNQERIRLLKHDATLSCLQARGLARPGGVERQKPLD